MPDLDPAVIQAEAHASLFREGLELGARNAELADRLDLAAYALLRASRALRAAAPTPPSPESL